MTTHIALLSGINVGGHKTVAMSDLRDVVADPGFSDVQTLLQTGNLVFRGNAGAGTDLGHVLKVEAEKRLGLRTDFLVRSAGVSGVQPTLHLRQLDDLLANVDSLSDCDSNGHRKKMDLRMPDIDLLRAFSVERKAGLGWLSLTWGEATLPDGLKSLL